MITAVDVGATKTLIAQFSRGKEPINELRFLTPRDSATFLDVLRHHLQQFSDISVLSIGVPGVVSTNGVIERCGVLPWTNFPLKARLSRVYPACPIHIENDAKMAALAEVNSLSPLPQLGLYITVSTGIGMGIVVNGKLLDAFKQSEPGHMTFLYEGTWQTWQTMASGSNMLKHFGKYAREFNDQEWQWAVERLTIGLAALIPALQPEVIIFGGSVGDFFTKFGSMLKVQLRKKLPAFVPIPQLKEAQHPTEAVLYGCYYYASHQYPS